MVFAETMGRTRARICITSMALLTVACGSGTRPPSAPDAVAAPEPTEPRARPEGASVPSSIGPTEDEGAAADEGPDVAAESDESPAADTDPEGQDLSPPPAPPTPPPLPSEALVADGVAYLLDDPGSELRDKLAEQCEAKVTDDDPARLAECRSKARDDFQADVFVFEKLPGGKIEWTIYQRAHSVLKEIYSAQVTLVDERQDGFRLRLGNAQGARPVFKGHGDVPFAMPSKNELVLDDPTYGRLVYRAKFGLVGS
jgi:hypothetical protein